MLILCVFQALYSINILAQQYINYKGELTIEGKQTYYYTAQFSQHGDTVSRVTTYFDNTNKRIRVEMTKFRPTPLTLLSNKIDDYRMGEYLAQEVNGNRFTTRRRERRGEDIQEKSVTAENAIVSTLVSERIRQNVSVLDKGQDVKFILALPAMGIVTEMRLVKVENRTVQGVACVAIKLEPSNFMLKALMGEPSVFTMERAAPHRFMQYQGILGLPTDEGKQQIGTVVMKY